MPLSDRQIHRLAEFHGLLDPFVDTRLSSAGYDLTLADEFRVPKRGIGNEIVDPFDPPEFELVTTIGSYIVVPPHEFVLGRSVERVKMPSTLIGICLGRSTYARAGIITHVTPLEPGWEGTVTIEISNTNPLPVRVWIDRGITQVVFFRLEEMPARDYSRKGGRYQNQVGVTQGLPEV